MEQSLACAYRGRKGIDMTKVLDTDGREVASCSLLEQAIEVAIMLGLVTMRASLLILPDGRCLWTERRPSGVWALAGD